MSFTKNVKLQIRRKTKEEWKNVTTAPLDGEPCFEKDTHMLKIGDGTNKWENLQYIVVDDGELT